MKNIIVIVMVSTICLFLIACEGFIDVKGNVYEWLNAPMEEKGEIYIDSELPKGINFNSIGNAHVSFYYKNVPPMGPSISTPLEREKFLPLYDVSCDSEGKFTYMETVAPGEYPLKVVCEMDGYYPVEKIFTHSTREDNFRHKITIILVRKSF